MMEAGQGEAAGGGEPRELARFLTSSAASIARRAARDVSGVLPPGGRGVRRSLGRRFEGQLQELIRLVATYGWEAPRLFGERLRPQVRERLDAGFALREVVEESGFLHRAVITSWGEQRGGLPPATACLLAEAFTEAAAHFADVWLTHVRAEGAGFQEAALLTTVVHHLDEAILVVEADGAFSFATPATHRILGLTPRELVGTGPEALPALLGRLRATHGDGTPLSVEELPHVMTLASRQPAHLEAFRIFRPGGAEAILAMDAAPVADDEGELRGVVLTIRDRTERFHQALAMERAHARTRELYSRVISRSRLEAVGELASSTAHALNNQLNACGLRIRRLGEHPACAPEAAALERSVREIAALVARLQELGQSHAPGTSEPTDVGAVLHDALDLVRTGAAGAPPIDLEVGPVPPALADREGLLELLTTLLLAARDGSVAGGRMSVTAFEAERGEVVIRVRHEGPGLSLLELEQLFEPLALGAGGGVLSLAAARQAVRRWGGELVALALPGGGTTFETRLPPATAAAVAAAAAPPSAAVRPAPPEPAVEARPARPGPASPEVLVVDDDADNAEMLADLVREAGGRPTIARTGAEAMHALHDHPPDALLVDLVLPDMSGWDVVHAVRDELPSARVAVVSGLVAGRGPEAGLADAVFRKPVEPGELLRFLGLPDVAQRH